MRRCRATTEVERGGSAIGLPPGRPCLLHYLESSPFALCWLALSSEDFGRARDALQACQQEIAEALRAADQRAQAGQGRLDRVVLVRLQLFPITVPLKGR